MDQPKQNVQGQQLQARWQHNLQQPMDQQRYLQLQNQSHSLLQAQQQTQPQSQKQQHVMHNPNISKQQQRQQKIPTSKLESQRFLQQQQQTNQFQQQLALQNLQQYQGQAQLGQDIQLTAGLQTQQQQYFNNDTQQQILLSSNLNQQQQQTTAQEASIHQFGQATRQQATQLMLQTQQQQQAKSGQEQNSQLVAQQNDQFQTMEEYHLAQNQHQLSALNQQQQQLIGQHENNHDLAGTDQPYKRLQDYQGQQLSMALEETLRQQQEAAVGGHILDQDVNQQQLMIDQVHDDEQQQMLWQDEQERVRQYTVELLQTNPNITQEELLQAISQLYSESNNPEQNGIQEKIEPNNQQNIEQQMQIEQQYLNEQNLDELALQYNVDREQLQQILNGMQADQCDFGAQQVYEDISGFQDVQHEPQSRQDDELTSINTEQQRIYERKRDQNFARELRGFFKKMVERLGRDAFEKMSKQSEEICRQIDDVQKTYKGSKNKDNDQNKSRRQALEQKKLDTTHPQKNLQNREQQDDASQTSSSPSLIGEDNDGDSAIHSQLYGPNSNIDPDAFIQQVLLQLHGHEDLSKQFKRFLPDDDEDDKKSIERKYWLFRDQLQLLEAQNEKEILNQNLTAEQQKFLQQQSLTLLQDLDGIDYANILRKENGQVNQILISQLKNDAFQMLFELLRKYQNIKDNRCVQDALNSYGSKIMCVAEKYQKFLQIELSQPADQQQNTGVENAELDQQAMIKYQVEKLGINMKLVLSLIPQEIIDNYQVVSSGLSQNDDGEILNDQQQDQNILQIQPNSQRRKALVTQQNLQKSQETDKVQNTNDFVQKNQKPSGSRTDRLSRLQRRQQQKDIKDKALKKDQSLINQKKSGPTSRRGKQRSVTKGNLNKLVYKSQQVVVPKSRRKQNKVAKNGTEQSESSLVETSDSNAEEEEPEQEEEPEEEIEEEIEEELEEESTSKPKNQIDKPHTSDEDQDEDNDDEDRSHHIGKCNDGRLGRGNQMKSILWEIQQKFTTNFANLAKPEIQVFVHLQRQLKNELDWNTFVKLFCLYMEGVLGQRDFFNHFDERFGTKIKPELRKELQDLIPTRGISRRLQSDILKPWNDLENQNFEKIPNSSYYKIGPNFTLPICSAKLNPKNGQDYYPYLNERFLSLSMGSENYQCKIRNTNEELIFKNEDQIYKFDIQIEMFTKCYEIVEKEIKIFESLSKNDKLKYEFPRDKFKPLMYYWEKKYKDGFNTFIHNKTFHLDQLIQLKEGLGYKLQEIKEAKQEQLPQFEEVFRKHFMKSLDHRNVQYKEFIRKFLNKQDQMKEIKHIAMQNQSSASRSWNQLKGGNCHQSSFYHSFGTFIKNDLANFDPVHQIPDYPIDMKFIDQIAEYKGAITKDQDGIANRLSSSLVEKMPHARMVFNDLNARNIAIKIICLYIKFSQQLNSNDRPRISENLTQIIQNFLKIDEFTELYNQCWSHKPPLGIESLTTDQIELILNQDSMLYYIQRCECYLKDIENIEKGLFETQQQIVSNGLVQMDAYRSANEADNSSQQQPQTNLQQLNSQDTNKLNQALVCDLENMPTALQLTLAQKFKSTDDFQQLRRNYYSTECRKDSDISEYFDVPPIKIQIQKTVQELRKDIADYSNRMLNTINKTQMSKQNFGFPYSLREVFKSPQKKAKLFSSTENEQIVKDKEGLGVPCNDANPFVDNISLSQKSKVESPLKGAIDVNQNRVESFIGDKQPNDITEKFSIKSNKSPRDPTLSLQIGIIEQLEKQSIKVSAKNINEAAVGDTSDSPSYKQIELKDYELTNKKKSEEQSYKGDFGMSPQKLSMSPEKKSSSFRKFPQKYEKLIIEQPIEFENIQQNSKSIGRIIDEVDNALFLPFYNNKTATDNNYSLMYAPSNVFIFLKLFYSLYERVLIAQTLIRDKINQDLSEMSIEDKIKFGLCSEDSETGQVDKQIIEEVFYRERYEYLLKGIFATTTQVASQPQQVSLNGIGYTHGHQNLLDHNKYEDFGRQLLGKNAFLLFQIDKIITQAVKQLQLMHTDHAYQKSKDLYKNINQSTQQNKLSKILQTVNNDIIGYKEPDQLNDRVYLAQYAELIVDQFSLKDIQNQQMGCLRNNLRINSELGQLNCPHKNSANLIKQTNGLLQDAIKQEKDANSQSHNASTAANSNFQVFRFLWSKKSQILSIHFIQLNPYMLPAQSGNTKNFKRIMQENYEYLQQIIIQPTPTISSKCSCNINCNYLAEITSNQLYSGQLNNTDLINAEEVVNTTFHPEIKSKHQKDISEHDPINYSKRLNPPIFLKRSIKIMKKVRQRNMQNYDNPIDNQQDQNQIQVNGMISRVVPHLNQITFEKNTEDVLITRRKSHLKFNELHKLQIKKQAKAQEIRQKRLQIQTD